MSDYTYYFKVLGIDQWTPGITLFYGTVNLYGINAICMFKKGRNNSTFNGEVFLFQGSYLCPSAFICG